MRTDCDDAWFTSRRLDMAVGPVAAALTGAAGLPVLERLSADGLRVWLFVLEPGPPGAICLLGRLRVGRRWKRVEVRVDAWSCREARVRLAPARRGIRRTVPGYAFYGAAAEMLVRLEAIIELLLTAADNEREMRIAA